LDHVHPTNHHLPSKYHRHHLRYVNAIFVMSVHQYMKLRADYDVTLLTMMIRSFAALATLSTFSAAPPVII
jgi:hypothetical protein